MKSLFLYCLDVFRCPQYRKYSPPEIMYVYEVLEAYCFDPRISGQRLSKPFQETAVQLYRIFASILWDSNRRYCEMVLQYLQSCVEGYLCSKDIVSAQTLYIWLEHKLRAKLPQQV